MTKIAIACRLLNQITSSYKMITMGFLVIKKDVSSGRRQWDSYGSRRETRECSWQENLDRYIMIVRTRSV